MPESRQMPRIGKRCYELRINDKDVKWRIMYHITGDSIVILHIFPKKTRTTPNEVVSLCKQRLDYYYQSIND